MATTAAAAAMVVTMATAAAAAAAVVTMATTETAAVAVITMATTAANLAHTTGDRYRDAPEVSVSG